MGFGLSELVADSRVPMVDRVTNRALSTSEREELAYRARIVEKFDVTPSMGFWADQAAEGRLSWTTYPPLRLPYPGLWVEALWSTAEPIGAFAVEVSADEPLGADLIEEMRKEDPQASVGRAFIVLKFFDSVRARMVRTSPYLHVVHIDEMGRWMNYHVSGGSALTDARMSIGDFRADALTERDMLASPLLFGLSLSNVKGARISEPRLRGNPNSKRKGRRQPPRHRYREITIPGSPIDGRRSVGGHRDIAEHLVRGHFKTFTPENPMFGKYTGTYWVPFHMRGKREHGVVDKDYEVKPPE